VRDLTPTRIAGLGLAALCVALGGYLALAQRSEQTLSRAQDELAAAQPARALARLHGLGGQAAGRALAVRAGAHIAQGRYAEAHLNLRAALRRDPNNWLLERDDAIVLLALDRRLAARRALQRALALNPRMDIPPGFVASGG
jgi:Flp pilus assembly protein TadD